MKIRRIWLLVLVQIMLVGVIIVIANQLRSRENIAPQTSEALSKDINLVTIGDSLSIDPPGSDLYYHYPSLLHSEYGITKSDSYAVGAAMTGSSPSPFKGMKLQFSEDVAGKDYNAIIVMGGVNDAASNYSAAAIEANLDWIYSQAKSGGLDVIAIPILPWGCFSTSSDAKMEVTKTVDAWIKTNKNVKYFIDAYGTFDDGNDCLKDEYSLDEVHINSAAHKVLAKMIYEKVFNGVTDTPAPIMKCGEVGCSAKGDDAACGYPDSGIECKSGYNNGEGRCEIVCKSNQTKTGTCTCVKNTPTPTVTATPTITASPTLSPTVTATATATPTLSPTVTATATATPTLSPTVTMTITYTPVITTKAATTLPVTVTPAVTVIPKTALSSQQLTLVLLGIMITFAGLFLKLNLKKF